MSGRRGFWKVSRTQRPFRSCRLCQVYERQHVTMKNKRKINEKLKIHRTFLTQARQSKFLWKGVWTLIGFLNSYHLYCLFFSVCKLWQE